MDNQNIRERLTKIVLEHPELTKNDFLKAFNEETGMIIIVVNGQDREITIDQLENSIMKNEPKQVNEQIETIEEVPANTVNMPTENVEVMDDSTVPVKEITNLKEMSDAALNKDEASIDKALETFAIDEKTGSINMNKAIKIVTDNSIENIANSVRDNTVLADDLSKYNIKGNFIGEVVKSDKAPDVDSLIDSSFNNILVYVDVSKLKNIVYTDEQVQKAKSKYATSVNDRLNVLGLNKQDNVIKLEPDNKKEEQPLSMSLKPDTNIKKAGFADIFILTVIILIYAAIIINLISKLQ